MLLRLRPAPALAAHVDCLWYSARPALPHDRERALPTGCADIVVPLLQDALVRYETAEDAPERRLRGAVVQGAWDRVNLRGTAGPSVVAGVHFKPGGAAAFLGGALPSLRNRTELLEDVWGLPARGLHERMLAAPTPRAVLQQLHDHLLSLLPGAAPVDPLAAFAIDAFARHPAAARIAPVQQASGLSPAQFIQRFEHAVGLTPKRCARVLRFAALLPTLAQGGGRDWAQLAVGAGYADQAHLVREFRALAGVTPATYAPVRADQPTHVAWGAAKKSSIQGARPRSTLVASQR